MLPACVAWIVHVPAETRVTVAADTVQTPEVVEAKLTARPEEAVAPTANGAVPNGWLESAAKEMVWLAGITWKLCTTGDAAA